MSAKLHKRAKKPAAMSEDAKWECDEEKYQRLLQSSRDAGFYSVLALIAAAACFLLLVFTLVPLQGNVSSLSDGMEKLAARQSTTNALVQGLNSDVASQANASNPFCYGYTANGTVGYAIDVSKVTTECNTR